MGTLIETVRGTLGGAWAALPSASVATARADIARGEAKIPLYYGDGYLGDGNAVEAGSFSLMGECPDRALHLLVEHNDGVTQSGFSAGGMRLVHREDAKVAVAAPATPGLLSGPAQSFPMRTRLADDAGKFVDVAIDMAERTAHLQAGRMANGMTEGVTLRIDAERIVTDGILFFFDARKPEFLVFLNKLGAAQGIHFDSPRLSDALLVKAAELLYAAQFGDSSAPELKFFGRPVAVGSNREGDHPDLFSLTMVALAPPAEGPSVDGVRSGLAALELTKRAFGMDWQYQVLIRRPDGFVSERMGIGQGLLEAGLECAVGRAV